MHVSHSVGFGEDMKVGDLVQLHGSLWSSWQRQDEIGIVLRLATREKGMMIQWSDGPALFARPDHLEVINES